MAFGATPTDSGSIPISCAYVPGTGFIAVAGSATTSTDGSSNTSTAVMTSLAPVTTTSGTLQTAQAGSANGTTLSVAGMGSVAFTVNMTGFTGTINFEATEDGTNYDPFFVMQSGTNTIATTIVGSTTSSIHIHTASFTNLQSVRARTSGVSAGNVTVTGHTCPLPLDSGVKNVNVVSGSITANAGTNLNTSALALESGGNLATLAGAITSAKIQANVAQVAGTTTDTNSGSKSAGTQRVVLATDQPSLSNALSVSQSGTWTQVPNAATSGGTTFSHSMSGASTNATSLKGSAGQLYGFSISNANAAARYFKVYNKATSPTVGSDTPILTAQIPPNSTVVRVFPLGLVLGTGIAWCATTGIADSDTGAVGSNDLSIDIDYK